MADYFRALLVSFGILVNAIGVELAYRDPLDFSGWEQFRTKIHHPCGLYHEADIERVRRLIKTDSNASAIAASTLKKADAILEGNTPEYLKEWISHQRGLGYMGPCPACRDKGLRWHPNGTWTWNKSKPDQVTCSTCHAVFPNEKYPETIHFRSKWDPRQEFSYCGGEPFKMYGTLCRPSFSGIIRSYKLFSTFGSVETLTYAYIYSGDAKYAEGVRRMLLRYAEVVPHYMFTASIYNEVADCDPHVASRDPYNLPTDEITPPPNKPDRKIHVGYWVASRLGSTERDGTTAVAFSLAYDITCTAKWPDGRSVYTPDECYRIEKDLLLELTYHFVGNTKIDNKSVNWRAASAAVGCVVGHPDLARYGIEGLYKTVNEWLLPDFTTSESGGYLIMVLMGIRSFPFWFRDYCEPADYIPPDGGAPLRHFNLFRDTAYGICWENAISILQGDLIYPPIADTPPFTRDLPQILADQLLICNPTARNLSFFRLNNQGRIRNDYFRLMFAPDPSSLDGEAMPEFCFEDSVFPYLQQGFMRYGEKGREGLAILNASDYGGHHHFDSLGLTLWHKKEVLHDLGYLWDHPDKKFTSRTAAHNLVVVDEAMQISKGRGGSFSLFETAGPVKAMRASSTPYKQVSLYERTVLQVDHGEAGFYWLDLFRVQGGEKRDYLFHGVNNEFSVNGVELPKMDSADAIAREASFKRTRFCVKIAVPKLGTWDVSDVELHRVDKAGARLSDNLAVEFPETVPSGSKTCKGWGKYIGNGKASWEPCQGRMGRGVRYHALSTAPGVSVINHALCIGECDGFRGMDAFLGEPGQRYHLRFYARGEACAVKLILLQFRSGEENSKDGRMEEELVIRDRQIDADWKLFEVDFTLQETARISRIQALPITLFKEGADSWSVCWNIGEGQRFAAFSPYVEGESLLYAQDWGQRFFNNKDRGAKLPYFLRRRTGGQLDSFVTVFNSYFGKRALVQDVAVSENADGLIAVVRTALGEDVFLFSATGKELSHGEFASDAEIGVLVSDGAGSGSMAFFQGTRAMSGARSLHCAERRFEGRVVQAVNQKDEAYFVLEGNIPQDADWKGHTLITKGEDGFERPYPIRKSAWVEGAFRVYPRFEGLGLPVHETQTWALPATACLKY